MGAAGGSKWVKHYFCTDKSGCPYVLKIRSARFIRVLHLFDSYLFIIPVMNSITKGIM